MQGAFMIIATMLGITVAFLWMAFLFSLTGMVENVGFQVFSLDACPARLEGRCPLQPYKNVMRHPIRELH
jgi:hypothetical protein